MHKSLGFIFMKATIEAIAMARKAIAAIQLLTRTPSKTVHIAARQIIARMYLKFPTSLAPYK